MIGLDLDLVRRGEPLPREEVTRRLAEAVAPSKPFENPSRDGYFGEVEAGGFDFTGPVERSPWNRSSGWTGHRNLGS